jgi:hypothetical protein
MRAAADARGRAVDGDHRRGRGSHRPRAHDTTVPVQDSVACTDRRSLARGARTFPPCRALARSATLSAWRFAACRACC